MIVNLVLYEFEKYTKLDYAYSIADVWAIGVFFLLIIFFVALATAKYKKNNPKLFRMFISCFMLKLFGCLAFVAVFTYYYGGGDTFRYYRNAKPLISMASYSPTTFLGAMSKKEWRSMDEFPLFRENYKPGHLFNMQGGKTNYLVVRFVAFFGIFNFGSYLAISLCFAAFSTLGVWALYRTFTRIFPGHEYALSIPIIFFPSVWFWGSSIMKDSLVMGFLGFFTYSIYKIFIERKNIPFYSLVIVATVYFLMTTKEYVLIAYLPALLLWLVLNISNRLSIFWKRLTRPFLLVIALGAILIVAPRIGEVSEKYAVDQVLATAENTGRYIARVSEKKDGSAYSLGNISYTPQGLITLFPKAVSVSLFQPFLFQVKNPVMLLSAIESTMVLFFTLFVIFRIGPFKFYRTLSDNPFLIASLTFSLFFAFAIGVSTFNYGALARYKLPCLPFYGIVILYPYSLYIKQKKELLEQSDNQETTD